MAYTATKSKQTVFGDQRVFMGLISADAASGTVSFGFGTIDHVVWAPASMATAGIRVRKNALAAGTSAAGTLGISGAASGDDLFVTVYGH